MVFEGMKETSRRAAEMGEGKREKATGKREKGNGTAAAAHDTGAANGRPCVIRLFLIPNP